jgi:hypothetical protein
MVAKTIFYILGGLLIIPGLFQHIGVIQLQVYRDTFMGAAVEAAINQKISFGCVLLIIGGALVFAASRINNNVEGKN